MVPRFQLKWCVLARLRCSDVYKFCKLSRIILTLSWLLKGEG